MTFIMDRDEREDIELNKLKTKLGERGKFFALKKRELENYLLSPQAVFQLIMNKAETGPREAKIPATVDEVRSALQQAAVGLKDRCVGLHVARKLLSPAYIDRLEAGSDKDKLALAVSNLTKRAEGYEKERAEIEEKVGAEWERFALDKAPGSEVLGETLKLYGFRFLKERERLDWLN